MYGFFVMKSFRDYTPEKRRNYITLSTGEYYPDILQDACRLYTPVLETFSNFIHSSESSSALYMSLSKVPNSWMRIQLCRIFRKYVSPETPVEMLKKATLAKKFAKILNMDLDQYKLFKKDLTLVLTQMRLYVLYYGNIKTEVKKVTI